MINQQSGLWLRGFPENTKRIKNKNKIKKGEEMMQLVLWKAMHIAVECPYMCWNDMPASALLVFKLSVTLEWLQWVR